MEAHAPALIPLSVQGSEWSPLLRYQSSTGASKPYSPSLTSNHGPNVTPPASGHASNSTNASSSVVGRRPGSNDNPSPPSSIARTSDGHGSQARAGSSMSRRQQVMEEALAEHHAVLKAYLVAAFADEKGRARPNKARDKLLRLSAVQFQELSTDVYDELRRREDHRVREETGSPTDHGPQFLLAKDNYHPKRNQARQKLSTLAPERFRQLAMDVYYELERRYPRFAAIDIERMDSPVSSIASSALSQSSRHGKAVGVGGATGYRGPGSRVPPSGSPSSTIMPEPLNSLRTRTGNEYGRPLPKTFQSNTIIPNKSTMVEDDGEQSGLDENVEAGDRDAFGLEPAERLSKTMSSRSYRSSDREQEFQAQVAQLQETIEELHIQLRGKDEELARMGASRRAKRDSAEAERAEWSTLKTHLERRVKDAQNLNDSMRLELDVMQRNNAHAEHTLKAQLEEANQDHDQEGWKMRHDVLERELREQQEVTELVRREASQFLKEMRNLTESGGQASESEERLLHKVSKLEDEVKEWKSRYVRTKTQLRNLRASSMGLSIQPSDTGKFVREGGFTEPDGLIKDVHVTKFQIAIDELLYTARKSEPSTVLNKVKHVVVCVRNITEDVQMAGAGSDDMSTQGTRLRAKVSATANNLTTACKIHATSNGISPLSLLDAAASHLTAAVVELIRTVKIRPTPAGIVGDDDDGKLPPEAAGYSSLTNGYGTHSRETSGSTLTYSSANSPRHSGPWASKEAPSACRQSPVRSVSGPLRFRKTSVEPRIRENQLESIKENLEAQTQTLVSSIQALVDRIRQDDDASFAIRDHVRGIAAVVEKVVVRMDHAIQHNDNPALRKHIPPITERLEEYKASLVAVSSDAETMSDPVAQRHFTKTRVPPLAFQVARRTKELRLQIDRIENGELTEADEVRLEVD